MTDIFKGATSNSVFIELVDSTTGLPKTGIVHTDVTGSYVRTRSARVAITMATLASASASFSSGGFILIDDTNQPGVYRIDVPDAAFATGAVAVVVTVKATGCRTVSRLFNLVDINNQVACLPNVAAGGIGGLLTAPTTANTGLANVTQFGGTAGTFAAGVPTAELDSAATAALVDLIWDEATSGHTTAGTYGGRIVRATNSNTEVQITGSNHIAADIHDLQSGVISAGDFAANAITASALATDAVTEIQSGLATAAALATESTKITAIETFATRVTTGLVADGAVYQFTANMLELGPAGSGGGSGTGARTVTITVNDGTTVLQNATVRMTEGANTFTSLTNVTGVAVFNLDDATYTVGITKSGYSYAGTTLIVNGTETATYSMTVVSITPPSNPSLSAIVVLCLDAAGQPEAAVAIDIRIVTVPSGSQNIAYKGSKQTATSDANGIANFEVVQGSVCEWKRGKADVWSSVTIDSDSVTNVTSLIGSP